MGALGRGGARRALRLSLVGAALAAVLGAPAAAAERRTAVVIANERYGEAVLPTAGVDGDLVAMVLREAAFDVLVVRNVAAADWDGTLDAVARHVEGSAITVVYYAGAGTAAKDGVRLMSVDGGEQGLPLDRLVETVDAGAAGALMMLDGIPAPALAAEAATRSVAPVRRAAASAPRPGILVGYSGATAPPESEGRPGGNSVFATVFANALAEPGKGVQAMLREVRRTVREATRGRQVPVAEGDVGFDAVLKPKSEDPVTLEARPGLDVVTWNAIKDSAETGDFARFREAFPASPMVERAALRMIAVGEGRAEGVGRLSEAGTRGVTRPAQGPATSLAFGVSGDRTPPAPLRVWPETLPATPNGLASLATACDAVAGDPDDPMRLSPGIRWGLVNLRVALRTCLFELARAPKNPRLLFQVGRLFDMTGRFAWAESFYQEAALAGYSAAYANLAYLSMTGRGRPADPAAAIPILRQCADLGNPRCRTDLGFAYMIGLGVETSTEEGVLWLRLASAGGWPNSMDLLANMHLDGWGVPKDEAAAIELFLASAHVGNTNAMTSLGHRHLDGRGVAKDPAEARRWFEKATADGNAFAPLFLGQLHLSGTGVKKDAAKGFALVSLAAERGFGEARLRLGDLYDKGTGTKKNALEAAFNYALTERQSFEHPVQPQFIEEARGKLEKLRKRLSAEENAELDRRIAEHAALNGPG